MSRAFTKERDEEPQPPILTTERSEPHPVTARGLEKLREELAHTTDERRRAALGRRIDSAVVTGPPADRDVVAFGATVTVTGAAPAEKTFTIVGEDEADIPAGTIPVTSPLAQALLGAHAGDETVWHRPIGDRTLMIRSIRYDET